MKEKEFDNYLRMKKYLSREKKGLTLGQLEVLLFVGRKTQTVDFIEIDEIEKGIGINKDSSYGIIRKLRSENLPLIHNGEYSEEVKPALVGLTKDGREIYERILK